MNTAHQPSDRFNETIAKIAETKPVLVLQQALQLSDTAFRITASHAPYRQELTELDYDTMLAGVTQNQFRLFPGTLEPLPQGNGQCVVSFIIEANTAVEAYDEDFVRGRLRSLAANLFIDDNDNKIWRVVQNGDQKFLVQSVKEDFAALLGARLAKRSSQIVSSANYTGIVPANGDYLQFYHQEKGGLAWGFALTSSNKTLQVFDRETSKPVKIGPAHVVAAVRGTSIDNKHSLAHYLIQQANTDTVLAEEISPASLSAYLDYMKTLYADTDFYRELERLVRSRRGQPRLTELYHE